MARTFSPPIVFLRETITMLEVNWVKCGTDYCPLETVDLSDVTTEGIYIIWHPGDPSRVVRLGQGDISTRLGVHRNDANILAYAELGTLRVTWATVSVAQRDAVERSQFRIG